MRDTLPMNLSFLQMLLNEANVYNIDAVKQYIQQAVKDITDPEISKILAKKLQTWLINHEPNLRPISVVPDDAPDWAKQSVERGDLMQFIPTPDLNDTVTNIAHYIQAAIANTASPDNNVVVRAKQELNGLPKIQNLELLSQKAAQYFAVGSKRGNAANTEGMEEEREYNGWIWYKLKTAEAFSREGKILQNCIGSYWTLNKCQSEGNTIHVLRTPQNDTVVAVRAHGVEIQEIKGKNNKPPVERYMPYVFNFVKDSNLKVTNSSAKNELKNAGYHVFADKLIVPLSQASDVYYDEATKQLQPLQPDSTTTVLDKTFNVFTKSEKVAHIIELAGKYGFGSTSKIYKGDIGNGGVVIIPVDKDTVIQPRILGNSDNDAEHRTNSAKYIVEVARMNKLKLSANVAMEYGLMMSAPYSPLADAVNLVERVGAFDKIDISTLSDFDAWRGAHLFVQGGRGPLRRQHISQYVYDKRIKTGVTYSKANTVYRLYDSDNKNIQIMVFVDAANNIFDIRLTDKATSAVLTNIRTLITQERLTISKTAIESKDIVIVPPSDIMTKKEFISRKIEGKTGRKNEIEFENGDKFKRLTGTVLTDWLEQADGTTTQIDTVYMLYRGETPIIAVPVSKNKILGMYSTDSRHNIWRARELEEQGKTRLPDTKSLDVTYMPYVKALAKKLNLTTNTKGLSIVPGSRIATILQTVVANPTGINRAQALKSARVHAGSAPGIDASYNVLDRPLLQLGLITQGPGQRRNSINLSPTEKGNRVAERLRQNETVSMFDLSTARDLNVVGGNTPDAAPAPAPRQPREPREPAAPRAAGEPGVRRERVRGVQDEQGGTKSERIYNLFVQLTNDAGGTMPTRGDFIALIMEPPYNMTRAGASTYQYNAKTRYQQEHGVLGETFTFKEWLMAML